MKIQASVSKGWLHKYWGFTFTEKYYTDPLFRHEQDKKINILLREKFPGYAIYNMESNLVQAEFVRDNHVLVGAIQPNMVLATLLGAHFFFYKDKDADVSIKPLENISRKEELPVPESILQHALIKELDRQIEFINENYSGLRVIPPFFWDESGRATIHGIFTSSLKLIGDNIMIWMMSDPDLVHAIHQWIADAYFILLNHFSATGKLAITSVHVGECAGTMLSSQLYNDFVVPYTSQLGKRLGAVRLHSCGFSDHLISAISEIANLRVFDTGSGTSIGMMRELMGKDFEINVAPPLELLRKGVPQSEVLGWLDKTLAENKDGNLQIAYHLEPDYDIQNALVIHEELERKGLIKNKRLY